MSTNWTKNCNNDSTAYNINNSCLTKPPFKFPNCNSTDAAPSTEP